MWDCGGSVNYPLYLPYNTEIYALFITNYDEDHIRGLPYLRNKIRGIYGNKSICAENLRILKNKNGKSTISPAMERLLNIFDQDLIDPSRFYYLGLNSLSVNCNFYYNSFRNFDDTNNCSLVTFLTFNGYKFIIPGDIEEPGWKKLLENPSFRHELKNVDVFIASHHGRESGYCKEVFNFCKPQIVVFSDSYIEYRSQEMASTYGRHCSGMALPGQVQTKRVLSTRNDGHVEFSPTPGGLRVDFGTIYFGTIYHGILTPKIRFEFMPGPPLGLTFL